jgi:hypothetical protein
MGNRRRKKHTTHIKSSRTSRYKFEHYPPQILNFHSVSFIKGVMGCYIFASAVSLLAYGCLLCLGQLHLYFLVL